MSDDLELGNANYAYASTALTGRSASQDGTFNGPAVFVVEPQLNGVDPELFLNHTVTGIAGAGYGWGGIGVYGRASYTSIPNRSPLDVDFFFKSGIDPGVGVFGDGEDCGEGVRGKSMYFNGVTGITNGSKASGVYGINGQQSGIGYGVFGVCNSPDGVGVEGQSRTGVAVCGRSDGNYAIEGVSKGVNKAAIIGTNYSHAGTGVAGQSNSTLGSGVYGLNGSNGPAVTAFSLEGIGFHGVGGSHGAELNGKLAPLRLVPSDHKGAPTTGAHLVGELYVDIAGDLYFCRASGTAGTWVKLT